MSSSRDVLHSPADAQATAQQLERLVRAVEEQTAMLQRVSERIDSLEAQLRELLTPDSQTVAAIVGGLSEALGAVDDTPAEIREATVAVAAHIPERPRVVLEFEDRSWWDPSMGTDWRNLEPAVAASELPVARRRLLPESRNTED